MTCENIGHFLPLIRRTAKAAPRFTCHGMNVTAPLEIRKRRDRRANPCRGIISKTGDLLVGQFALICPTSRFSIPLSSPLCKNISLFQKPKSVVVFAPSCPHKRGGSRSSRTLRRDAVDALVARDERRQRGRRSRVVLAPRRW